MIVAVTSHLTKMLVHQFRLLKVCVNAIVHGF